MPGIMLSYHDKQKTLHAFPKICWGLVCACWDKIKTRISKSSHLTKNKPNYLLATKSVLFLRVLPHTSTPKTVCLPARFTVGLSYWWCCLNYMTLSLLIEILTGSINGDLLEGGYLRKHNLLCPHAKQSPGKYSLTLYWMNGWWMGD